MRSIMPIRNIRPSVLGELHDPFFCDHQAVMALVTASAFMALADGRVEAIERSEAVHHIDRRRVAHQSRDAPSPNFFDQRARRLRDADLPDLIVDGLRPVACQLLTSDVIRIAERVLASGRYLIPNEVKATTLIRLITMTAPERKGVNRLVDHVRNDVS
jgi:hypothetical protein